MKQLSIVIFAIFSLHAFSASGTYYNVKDFGAVGDGKHLDSPMINKAIDMAVSAGAGTVYFPAGTYLSGSIRLKNNITLYLEVGCTILGAPQDIGAYDSEESFEGIQYQDGGHTHFHNSLIWGENLSNVSIIGLGMINGGGLVSTTKEANKGLIGKASKSIALKLCTNVLIRDITIFHGGHFAILVTGCNRVTVDNVTIDTNRDGIDIDCCSNTVVSNCRVNSPNDDAIVPKSSFALNKKWITENLTITNCQVSGFEEGTLLDGRMLPSKLKYGRIKFGTESNGGFRNCVVANCTFRSCKGLALEEVDGGIMDNISISNLTMTDVDDYPIYITLGRRLRDPDTTCLSVGRRISISNVVGTVNDNLSGIHISGMPGSYLEDIHLSNIQLVFKGGGTKKQSETPFPELGKNYPEIGFMNAVVPSYGVF
ncbi:MAG: glycoside hydrolase family 28 protein, partial [Bacteroidota bacterium]|nr:glycoside hydrolase family 28 protein [Bacteroidota bacterium]